MKGPGWYLIHEGRRLYAQTKAQAQALAQIVADKTGAPVTVRKIARELAGGSAPRQVKRNPAGAAHKESTRRRNGKWAKVSGRPGRWAAALGWEGQIQAIRIRYYPTRDSADIAARHWLDDSPLRSNPAGAARPLVKRNPLELDIPAYARAADRARRGRLEFLAATKARRLAKSLRGKGHRGKVKAQEERARKTAKFCVYAKRGAETFELYRASRAAADKLADEFRAAKYRVEIAEV